MSCAIARDRLPGWFQRLPWGDIGLFGGFLALYLLTEAATQSIDSVWIAIGVERSDFGFLFHPHHLLYMPSIWVVWRLFKLFGADIRAIDVAQIISALSGAGALVVFRRLLFSIRKEAGLSFAAAALLGTTGAFWQESTDGESYPLALFFSLACMFCGIVQSGRRGAILAGVLGSAAFCLHQQTICLAAIPFIYLVIERDRTGSRLAKAGWFTASATALTVVAYAASILFLRLPGSEAAFRWLFRYPITMPERGLLSLEELSRSVQGLARTFLFVPYDYFSFSAVIPCMVILMGYLGWSWASRRKDVNNRMLMSLSIGVLIGGAFAAWWDPFYHKFWMFPFGAGVLLLSAVARLPRPTLVVSCLTAAVLAVNFCAHFRTRANPADNPYKASADALEGLDKSAWIAFLTPDMRLRIQMIYFNGYRHTGSMRDLVDRIDIRQTEDALREGLPVYLFLSKADIGKMTQQYYADQTASLQREFWERFRIAPEPEFPLPDGKRGFYRLQLREASRRRDPIAE